jgi:hypothetical protein
MRGRIPVARKGLLSSRWVSVSSCMRLDVMGSGLSLPVS